MHPNVFNRPGEWQDTRTPGLATNKGFHFYLTLAEQMTGHRPQYLYFVDRPQLYLAVVNGLLWPNRHMLKETPEQQDRAARSRTVVYGGVQLIRIERVDLSQDDWPEAPPCCVMPGVHIIDERGNIVTLSPAGVVRYT